jgi:hypothetical protein
VYPSGQKSLTKPEHYQAIFKPKVAKFGSSTVQCQISLRDAADFVGIIGRAMQPQLTGGDNLPLMT